MTDEKDKKDNVVLEYKINFGDDCISGELLSGEMKLLEIPYKKVNATFTPGKGLDVGAGLNEIINTNITGGVVGVILDGRGRKPFKLSNKLDVRIKSLLKWSNEIDEYPKEDLNYV